MARIFGCNPDGVAGEGVTEGAEGELVLDDVILDGTGPGGGGEVLCGFTIEMQDTVVAVKEGTRIKVSTDYDIMNKYLKS